MTNSEMLTIKLVVIGASGVGKTSIRSQYISGRFSNGYRATIGADFITKTLPHPSNPNESLTLQIWDTAGQERFSSLSTAFFRGADAALLMFDVNTPRTMEALKKWWAEFCDKAPLANEDMEEYCCVVVGNKTDMVGSGNGGERVTESEALGFTRGLVPRSSHLPSPVHTFLPNGFSPRITGESNHADGPLTSSQLTVEPPSPIGLPRASTATPTTSAPRVRSNSIAIIPNRHESSSHSSRRRFSLSRSRSSPRFYGDTMTTTHTTLSIYHTPSSSLFDVYQSARSSPEPRSISTSPSATSSPRARRTTSLSSGSTSTGSAVTMTPSLFAREHAAISDTALTTPENSSSPSLPTPPARGPKLFFTSAKTGEGVADVFEYVAQRVVRQWEYEERLEARRMHMREASGAGTIRIGLDGRKQNGEGKIWYHCCAS